LCVVPKGVGRGRTGELLREDRSFVCRDAGKRIRQSEDAIIAQLIDASEELRVGHGPLNGCQGKILAEFSGVEFGAK
jgi:hypothetical protein